jgi:ribose transport system ATP-binding protein
MSLAIRFNKIIKEFGPVRVLQGVSFSMEAGKSYGLLGENGAGKSTLMKVLCGYEPTTSGSIEIDGQSVTFLRSKDAEDLGIILIHQEFSLAEELTVVENIFLGHEKLKGPFLDEKTMEAEALLAMSKVGLNCSHTAKVKELIVAEKQLVEIARALVRKAKLLVMDEPTATLTPGEIERLFALMLELKSSGVTIVYISHKLDEVERMTDEVIVMRDGNFVTQRSTASTPRHLMANLMVGRELADIYPPKSSIDVKSRPVIKVTGATVPGWVEDISFDVRPGEILGFAGLVGAGRTELFEGLLGLRPLSAGAIELNGTKVTIKSPLDAVKLGMTYLSEDRKGKGLHIDFRLQENVSLMALELFANPFLQKKKEHQALVDAVDEFGIRTGNLYAKARALSGGNQQKVALAKVLQPGPSILILDEPTRGVDIGAKREIYLQIQKLAKAGLAVVVVSSELMELIGLCHRVAVLRSGKLQVVIDANQLTEKELISHATGTK